MKFKKLIFGLAATPLLLVSCNNALSFAAAKSWIQQHYKNSEETTHLAIPQVSWDFHATKGTDAETLVYKIFEEINKKYFEEQGEQSEGVIPTHPSEKENKKIRIEHIQEVAPLNGTNFGTYSDENPEKNDIYKINNGCFSVTYKTKIEAIEPEVDPDTGEKTYTYATCGRVYNSEGYCTDFGYKANKYLNKDNSIKLKVLIHFIYEDDPIN